MFFFIFFFFNDTPPTEIYTLSLHDALPILRTSAETVVLVVTLLAHGCPVQAIVAAFGFDERTVATMARSEEHTSELQSHSDLVCRLLLEKKKKTQLAIKYST